MIAVAIDVVVGFSWIQSVVIAVTIDVVVGFKLDSTRCDCCGY